MEIFRRNHVCAFRQGHPSFVLEEVEAWVSLALGPNRDCDRAHGHDCDRAHGRDCDRGHDCVHDRVQENCELLQPWVLTLGEKGENFVRSFSRSVLRLKVEQEGNFLLSFHDREGNFHLRRGCDREFRQK